MDMNALLPLMRLTDVGEGGVRQWYLALPLGSVDLSPQAFPGPETSDEEIVASIRPVQVLESPRLYVVRFPPWARHGEQGLRFYRLVLSKLSGLEGARRCQTATLIEQGVVLIYEKHDGFA